MYECAIRAQWIIQVDGAGEAVYNDHSRQHKNLLTQVRDLNFDAANSAQRNAEINELEDSAALPTSRSEKFEDICNDLVPGGPEAYLYYRIMSGLSHPSALIVDRYYASLDQPPYIGQREEPSQAAAGPWGAIATCALV